MIDAIGKQISNFVQEYFEGPFEFQLTPITSQSTYPCYCLEVQGDQFFVKQFDKPQQTPERRKLGFQLQQFVSEQGMATRPIALLDKTVWIEDWLDGAILLGAAISMEEKIEALARTLVAIHSIEIGHLNIELPQLELKKDWTRYAITLNRFEEYEATINRLSLVVQQTHDVCLCHNDLSFEHIFGGGAQIKVIDWEYAAMGSRYFDLVAASKINRLNDTQKTILIHRYAELSGITSAKIEDECQRMQAVVDFTFDIWSMALNT